MMHGKSQSNDSELIHLIQRNPENFKLLISRYKNLVYHIVSGFLNHPKEIEAISHEIFVKVYLNLKQFKNKSSLSTWIGKISYHYCISIKRKSERLISLNSNNIQLKTNLPEFEWDDRKKILHKEMEKLPELYQTILKLYHFDNLQYKEIGEIVGRPEGTIKSDIYRARKALKDLLLKQVSVEDLI